MGSSGSSTYGSDEEMSENSDDLNEFDSNFYDDYESEHEDAEEQVSGFDYRILLPSYNPENSKESIVIPTRTVDLKEIAALNVAIALWKHANVPQLVSDGSNVWMLAGFERALFNRVSGLTKELSIPPIIRDQIDKYVPKMRNEVKDWVTYHHQRVFFNTKDDKSVYYHIYYIIWYCNGTIDYKETAKNLLNSPRLSEVEKYHLLCTYCLKDDIERMPRSLFTNNVIDRVDFSIYPLIFYWTCYRRNELDIVLKHTDGESVECCMVKHRYVDNWPAKEYFFDLLNSDEQLRVAIWLIDNFGMKYLKLILMKLKESQRLRLYMDRPVKIIVIFVQTGVHHEDVLATWSEIRNLITEIQFVTIFRKMLSVSNNRFILNEVWASACDEFKRYVFACSDQYEIMENVLRLWDSDRDDFFFTMMKDADKNLKANFSQKRYFFEVCEKLISINELKLFDRLLNSCFDDVQDFHLFKLHFASADFFGNHCLKLIVSDQLPLLEDVLGSFFANPEETVEFKKALTNKEYFMSHLMKLMIEYDFKALERLLNVCLPNVQELARFKQNFVKKECFNDYCTTLITTDPNQLFEKFSRIFFPLTEDLVRFKYQLTSKDFFFQNCESLVINDQFKALDELLNSFLPNAEDVLKFKRDFALISTKIKSRCLNLYGNGNFKSIDSLLNRFMSSCPNLLLEYKKTLILSSEGLDKATELFEKRPDVLNRISADNFIPNDLGAELKKTIIFSRSVILKLQSWIREGRLSLLKDRVNQFLTTDVDKRALKRQVFANPLDFIGLFFFRNDDLVWQSLMVWRFENEASVQEYKNTMPVDEIFNDILKKCVFEVYDASYLRQCKFRYNFEMVPVDRFLKWYFETPRSVKEYKLNRVDLYMQIETIRTLLKKTDPTYLKKVMTWFFNGDNGDIVNFQAKNRGRKILRYLDAA